eukprot:8459810-Alexandrium_andersonii.AAC.1
MSIFHAASKITRMFARIRRPLRCFSRRRSICSGVRAFSRCRGQKGPHGGLATIRRGRRSRRTSK